MHRKMLILVMVLLTIFSLPACIIESLTDVKMEEHVSVVGIDEEDGKVKMTIILVLIQPLEGGAGGPKVSIYNSTGDTMFEAFRNLHAYTDKHPVFEHNDFYLIGEETARNGINKYLDLIVRDHEPKQNAKVIITQGSSAEELIKATDFEHLTLNETLASLFKEKGALSQSCEITILEYIHMMTNPRESLYLPCIQMVDHMVKSEEDKDKKNVRLDGCGIFSGDQLVGYVNGKMARGVNWVIDEIDTGIIIVEDSDDYKISLEIISNKPKIEVDFSGEKPTATIKIEFSTNIVEYQGAQDIFKNDKIEYIVEEQNKVVKKEITEVIEYLQELETDVLCISDRLYHKYPKKTNGYDNIWSEVFADMKISVEVESTIERTYNINQPVAYKKKAD